MGLSTALYKLSSTRPYYMVNNWLKEQLAFHLVLDLDLYLEVANLIEKLLVLQQVPSLYSCSLPTSGLPLRP